MATSPDVGGPGDLPTRQDIHTGRDAFTSGGSMTGNLHAPSLTVIRGEREDSGPRVSKLRALFEAS
jgi:hypothetical protein